jgi:purine-binding chemotaxis protein CheW
VLGLMNLRGQIVTVLDLGARLGLFGAADPEVRFRAKPVGIVLAGADAPIALAVDEVTDVSYWDPELLQKPPATLSAAVRASVRGVHAGEGRLAVVLDKQVLLAGLEEELSRGR